MSDPTFNALLEVYQERGKRVVELEQLCRDMYKKLDTWSYVDKEGNRSFAIDFTDRMQSLGLLEE